MGAESITPETSTIIVFLGLQGLLTLVNSVLSVAAFFKRQPPIDQTLAEYAKADALADLETRKAEAIASLETKNDQVHGDIFSIIRKLQASQETVFRDLERMIGRIEGKLERCPTICGGNTNGPRTPPG
jgi:hypothetical protein